MSSENLHIPRELLSTEARLLHNAIVSLQEELDAVDWYRQRAEDTENEELKQVLLHNMREEMEHASMLLEWLRRNNEEFAGYFKTYLFTEAPIVAVERAAEAGETAEESKKPGGGGKPPSRGSGLTVGRMKGGRGWTR